MKNNYMEEELVVYVVSWSFFTEGQHSTEVQLFKDKNECVSFFENQYNYMIESCKRHCDKLITFWEVFKTKEPLPEKDKYIFAFDMAGNDKTVTYVEDNVTKISYNINYRCLTL